MTSGVPTWRIQRAQEASVPPTRPGAALSTTHSSAGEVSNCAARSTHRPSTSMAACSNSTSSSRYRSSVAMMTRVARDIAWSKRLVQASPPGATLVRRKSSRSNGSTTFTSAPMRARPPRNQVRAAGGRGVHDGQVHARKAGAYRRRDRGREGGRKSRRGAIGRIDQVAGEGQHVGGGQHFEHPAARGITRASRITWRRIVAIVPASCAARARAAA